MHALSRRVVGLSFRFGLLGALLMGGLVFGRGERGVSAHAEHGMPARLQQGTCEAIGPVAFELNGVGGTEDLEGNEVPAPEAMGAAGATEVKVSVTTVAAPLDAIVSGGHALIVYLSDDAMDKPVACGAIGGIVVGEDLVVGLEARGDEGMNGIALFRAEGDQTVVSVFLTAAERADGHGHEAEATPAA
jgi:hypothetical protein